MMPQNTYLHLLWIEKCCYICTHVASIVRQILLTSRYVHGMVIAHLVEKMSQKQCLFVNILRPRQIVRYFADDIFKSIFLNENVWIPIKISLKFVPRGPINNILALVQLMAWRRPGDMPLSWPMMVRLPTHICVTRLLHWRYIQTTSPRRKYE